MAWMSKAAIAVASRKSQRCSNTLIIRSILRVEFSTGSTTSDHLILRTRLNAVFDEGRSAEVEVRVSKQRLDSREETHMNTGYFFISGGDIGTGTDFPFSMDDTAMDSKLYRQAAWRRMQLLARRQLLGGIGDPVRWHVSLQREATVLTIKSLLRLVHYKNNDGTVKETVIPIIPASKVITSVKWAKGRAMGRTDTFVLEVKGTVSGYSLRSLVETLGDDRPKWDEFCWGVETIEKEMDPTSSFPYDIVVHRARSPKVEFGLHEDTEPVVSYCLLRTWEVDDNTKTAIFASQSVFHDKVDSTKGRVLPSGFFLRQGNDNDIHVQYMAEHELAPLRRVVAGKSDDVIVGMLAKIACNWIEKLQAIEETGADTKS